MKLPGIPGPFGVPWQLVGILIVFALFLAAVYFFGQARHAQGVAEEKARAAEQIAAIQTEAAAAVREEAQAFRDRDRARDRSLAEARSTIEDVPHDAPASDFLVAWARADRSLHDGSPR